MGEGRLSAVRGVAVALCLAVLAACASAAAPSQEWVAQRPLHEIAAALEAGDLRSEDVVAQYQARIARIDRDGPTLNSVLALNPNALVDARARDAARALGSARGPLDGMPILLKDNIETADPMPTTAGSAALAGNFTQRDAPLAARLREAGAIILGKTNLSEWANFRSNNSISGWSAMGGQVRNPHMRDRSPCGSSSGSAVAVAVSLAAAAIGTETNGSIICPAAMNGIVGFKPTVGIVSQQFIVPISASQDTAGPMTLSVRDAAIVLEAMADDAGADFTSALSLDALAGQRIGVMRFAVGDVEGVDAAFEQALAVLAEAGAELVEIDGFETPDGFWDASFKVLLVEFRAGLNAYLASTGANVTTRTLADVITFNQNHPRELALFDQSIFELAETQPGLDDADYIAARTRVQRATREEGIDRMLREHDVAILVAPSAPPAFMLDAVIGDQYPGGTGAGWIAAIAGYPHLTVPMGQVRGLPVGLSFIGAAGADADLLAAGFAYEQRRGPLPPPAFRDNAEDVETVADAMRRPQSAD